MESGLHILCSVALACAIGAQATADTPRSSNQSSRRALTVHDTIEARQLLFPYVMWTRENPVHISPGGKRYLLVMAHGDLRYGGTWLELFSGSTESLAEAARGQMVVKLFTSSRDVNWLRVRFVRWFNDDSSVAFLWKNEFGVRQVVAVDLKSHTVRELTASETDVVEFDISKRGDTIVFAAHPKTPSNQSGELYRRGFVITDQELPAIMAGQLDGHLAQSNPEFYIQRGEQNPARKVVVNPRRTAIAPEIYISPSGRYAVLTAPPEHIPLQWQRYDRQQGDLVGLEQAASDRAAATAISQYWVLNTRSAAARPLFDAPRSRALRRIVWSPDESSVLVGPTYLPVDATAQSALTGSAVASVNIETGEFAVLPVPARLEGAVWPKGWPSLDVAQIGNAETFLSFGKAPAGWQVVSDNVFSARQEPPKIKIEVEQVLKRPPVLRGVDTQSGRSIALYEIHPRLKNVALSNVEVLQWKDSEGRAWTGTYYQPLLPESGSGRKVPLVVQLGGAPVSTNTFSLLGADSLTCYAAQPLASRGIAVLNVYRPDVDLGEALMTVREPAIIQSGIEAAIELLAQKRSIDSSRVGLLGFSRSGWYALYILTHSAFPYAAANVCDNFDGSYLQYVLSSPEARTEMEADLGAPPFGVGLQSWLSQAPGFRTERIMAPLRMERDQGGPWGTAVALASWEMFTRMRRMKQPIELYMVPYVSEGQHDLEGPDQQLASRSSTVDWFDFWLKGNETLDVARADQYARWRKMQSEWIE